MSTRSLIGISANGWEVEYIYCHWDGYVHGGVGEELLTHFDTTSKVEKLISMGDCSEIGGREREGMVNTNLFGCNIVQHEEDLEKGAKKASSPSDFVSQKGWAEYCYLFDGHEWYVACRETGWKFRELQEVFDKKLAEGRVRRGRLLKEDVNGLDGYARKWVTNILKSYNPGEAWYGTASVNEDFSGSCLYREWTSNLQSLAASGFSRVDRAYNREYEDMSAEWLDYAEENGLDPDDEEAKENYAADWFNNGDTCCVLRLEVEIENTGLIGRLNFDDGVGGEGGDLVFVKMPSVGGQLSKENTERFLNAFLSALLRYSFDEDKEIYEELEPANDVKERGSVRESRLRRGRSLRESRRFSRKSIMKESNGEDFGCVVGGEVNVELYMRYPYDSKNFMDDSRDFDGNDERPDFRDFTLPKKKYDSFYSALHDLTTGTLNNGGNNPIRNLKNFDLCVFLNDHYDDEHLFEFMTYVTSDGELLTGCDMNEAIRIAKEKNVALFEYNVRVPFKCGLKKDDIRLAREIKKAAKELGIKGFVEYDFDEFIDFSFQD